MANKIQEARAQVAQLTQAAYEKAVEAGKLPMCVQHCQAKCLEYGPLEELNAKLAAKTKQAVFALGE